MDVPMVLVQMESGHGGAGATVFLNSIFNHPDTKPEDIAVSRSPPWALDDPDPVAR